jgi:hypothetical protein
MATYLPGVTDTGLDPIQFNPNFPYMMNALQKATSTYDTNYNKIAQGYGNILNAPLSVSDNVVVRDQYSKEAKEKLQALASADLSIQSNVDEADKVFSPFWEDNDILTDYNKTAQISAQNKIYETLLTSSKEEDRKRAWTQGNTYVNLSRQELAQAKRGDGSIQKVNVRGYVPYINVTDEMNKELNAMGFKDGITLVSNGGNGYIMKMTNGEKTTVIYQDVVARLMQNHPEWQDIFKVQGTNQFYGSVLNRREQFGEDETTARRNVLESFRESSIRNAEKGLSNAQANVDLLEKEFKSLEAKLNEEGNVAGASDRLALEYANKKTELESAQSAKSYYQKNKEEFSSDDYYKANDLSTFNGESYFARMIQDRFIEGYSKVRASAVSQDVNFDATYNAAKALENARYRDQTKYNEDRIIDTDGDGVPDYVLKPGPNDLQSNPSDLQGRAAAAGSKTKTTQQQLNTPIVGGVYGKQDATSYNQSYYNNFISTGVEKGQEFTAAGINFVQSIPAFTKDYSGLPAYLNALSSVIQTGKYPIGVDKESLKKTYNQLKNNKVLPAEIPNYDELPSMQLKYMTDNAITKAKENNIILTTEQANNYSKYENNGADFYAYNQLNTKIKKEVIDKNPLLKAYTEKGELGVLDKVLEMDPAFITFYKGDKKPIVFKAIADNGDYYDKTITRDDIYKNFASGNYQYESGKKLVINNVRYFAQDAEGVIPLYAVNQAFKKAKKQTTETIKDLNTELNTKISNYISGDVENVVMSRGLILKTDLKDDEDKAQTLAREVLANKPKPLNYDRMVELAGDSEEIKVITDFLQEEPGNMIKVMSSTETALAGKNGNAVTKITLDTKALKENLPENLWKNNQKAIAAIMQTGLEYETPKPVFKKFFTDNYITGAIEDQKLKNGISASPFVKENLHYDYTVTLGANDTYVVSYGTKIIDPNTNEEKWTYRPDNLIFPKSMGLNEVIKFVQEEGYKNTVAVNNYRKMASQQSNVRKRLPNETTDQYAQRLIKMGKGQ